MPYSSIWRIHFLWILMPRWDLICCYKREDRIRFLGASGQNIFTNQSIHNVVLCECLFKDVILYLGTILNSKITNKSTNIFLTVAIKKTVKRTLLYSMKAKTRKPTVALLDLRWKHVHGVTQIISCSICVHEWLWNRHEHGFGGCQQMSVSRWICK